MGRVWVPPRRQRGFIINPFVFADNGADPFFSDVQLLLHGDGSNGGTVFTDSSSFARSATAFGNVQTSTAQFKYGTASILFDGSGDYLTFPSSSSAWEFPGDFCLETWLYLTAYSASYSGFYGAAILSTYFGFNSPGTLGWQLRVNGSASAYNEINLFTGATNLTWAIGSTVNLNTWYHLAVTRSGTSIRAFWDGVQQGATATNGDNFNQSPTLYPLYIGRLNDATFLFELNGYLDEVRVTNGAARYTANFTPPTAAFPDF